MGLLQKRKTRLQTRLKIVLSRLTPDGGGGGGGRMGRGRGGAGGGGGGGVYSTNVYTGRLRPAVQALTLLYTIFHEKVPLSAFVYLLLTNGTRFTYLV